MASEQVPLGHIIKRLTRQFASSQLLPAAKPQFSGVGIHLPLGHARQPHDAWRSGADRRTRPEDGELLSPPIPPDSEMLAEVIGHRLAEVRRVRGLTQRQVADRTGVTKGRVSQIERGKTSSSSRRATAMPDQTRPGPGSIEIPRAGVVALAAHLDRRPPYRAVTPSRCAGQAGALHGAGGSTCGIHISCDRSRYVTDASSPLASMRTVTTSALCGSPRSCPSAAVANARIGPECVATTRWAGGPCASRRRTPSQKRRTHRDGGSKCRSGTVSQNRMGSPPSSCAAQNRSISTTHPGSGPVPAPVALAGPGVLVVGVGDLAPPLRRRDREVVELRPGLRLGDLPQARGQPVQEALAQLLRGLAGPVAARGEDPHPTPVGGADAARQRLLGDGGARTDGIGQCDAAAVGLLDAARREPAVRGVAARLAVPDQPDGRRHRAARGVIQAVSHRSTSRHAAPAGSMTSRCPTPGSSTSSTSSPAARARSA